MSAGFHRKVLFRLEPDETGYPPDDWESLWATEVAPGLYQIDNVPFYVRGISWRDVVSVRGDDGELFFDELVEPSRHTVIRIIVFDDGDLADLQSLLGELGCSFESSHIAGLLSVDVPPETRYDALRHHLDEGETAGRWEYEEGSLRHKS